MSTKLGFQTKFWETKFVLRNVQGDTKKRELLKNPTKIEEIQEKKLLT